MAQRITNGENDFAEVIANITGCDIDTAHKVRRHMQRNRLATLDCVNGTIRVKHGAYLDLDYIQSIIAEVA